MGRQSALRMLVVVLVVLGSATAVRAQVEWKASYLQNPKKPEERTPVGADAAGLEDRHWLTLQYSEYAGFRPSMAVLVEKEKDEALPEAETEIGRMFRDIRRFSGDGDEGSSEEFSAERMTPAARTTMRAALSATNRFRMVDRGVGLQGAMAEQDMAAGGRVSRRSAVKTGNIRGASYGVKTTVIETNPEKEVRKIQVGAGILGTAGAALGGIAVGGKVAFCRLNVEVVDLETGDIIFDTMVDGTASEKTRTWGAAVGGLISRRIPLLGGGGARSESKQEAILTDAVRACAMKAAHYIATKMEDRPFETTVARVDGHRLIVIGGTDIGLRDGMRLALLSRGSPIVDPATGDTIDIETSRIGSVRVAEVKERSSVIEVVEGGAGAKAGDIVKFDNGKK